jgi:hypothetical protein
LADSNNRRATRARPASRPLRDRGRTVYLYAFLMCAHPRCPARTISRAL